MGTATATLDLMCVPDLAKAAGVGEWSVRKVLDELGLARRVGRVRVVDRADLGIVIEALDRRGYLPQPQPGEVLA